MPGLELGVNIGRGGVHTLIVFSPEWIDDQSASDGITRFLSSQFNTTPDEGSRTKDDIAGCLEKLDGYGKDYFVVFAHVDSDNGLFKELDLGQLEHVIETCGDRWQRVLGLQKVKSSEYIVNNWPGDTLPAFVEGSDPRDSIEEVGRSEKSCWLKIGDMSFESVRFALTDHLQRVSSIAPIHRSGPLITSIRFEGGLLDMNEYGLSEQLTTLIGSRGSGKSAVIECLRYALDFPSGKNTDSKYKDSLVKAMLANGGEVIVTGVNEHNQSVEVRRPFGFEPQVALEGKPTRLHPRDVFPNVLYFGQKDLGNRHENFESEFFAMLTGSTAIDNRHEEELLELEVKKAVNEYQEILKEKGRDDENAQESERLKHQLNVYSEKKVDKKLESLTEFDADRDRVEDFNKKFDTFKNTVGDLQQNWHDIIEDWPEIKSQTLKEPAAQLLELLTATKALKESQNSIFEELQKSTAILTHIFNTIQDIGRKEQEGFSKLLRDIDNPDLDLAAYRKMKLRQGQLVEILKSSSSRSQLEESALLKMLTASQNLYRFRRNLHRKEEAELNICAESIPKSIQLSSKFQGDRRSFDEFIASTLSGKHFKRTSREKLVKALSNGLNIFEKRDNIGDIIGENADVEKLRSALFDNLYDFLVYRVPDQRNIIFNGISIENLSLGQRATVILTLLTSLDRHPIMLLDQPEDDLDNETIFRNVVEPLQKRKKQCQFVIATHNANIPVLGDAEQILACREVEHGRFEHESGSLDCSATSKTIVNIMEGGAEAFLRRQKVLQQWSKSVY